MPACAPIVEDYKAEQARLLQSRRLQLLTQKRDHIRQNWLAYYKPHPKQDAFHRAGDKRLRLFRGGNRSGKSTVGGAEVVAWLLGERLWYPEGDAARRLCIPQRPTKVLTISTDWDIVNEVWTGFDGEGGKAWRMIPPNMVRDKRKNHSGAISSISLKNGSNWQFDTNKSFVQNELGAESKDWDAIHIDEPCERGLFIGASRGLMDRGGKAWFTLTHLTQPWITDLFVNQDGVTMQNSWMETVDIAENPTLSAQAIEDYAATLTEDEKMCRLHGIPLHMSGLVYKEFSRSQHVLSNLPTGWSSFDSPPRDWPIYFAIDPHPQTPHAVLFVTVSPLGQRIYYKDFFVHCSIEKLAQLIREHLAGRNVIWGKIDPIAYVNDPITETNMALELERCGVFVERATKAREQGTLRVQGELAKKPGSIFFAPSVRQTLWEIQRYCWDERENKPMDKDDHMMENLYRLELSEPQWVDPKQTVPPIRDLVIDHTMLDLEPVSFAL